MRIDVTKTDDPRAVPVTDRLAQYLVAWLHLRPQSCTTDYLFVTKYGGQLNVSAWGKQWQGCLTFARAQGHELPRIMLHSLRHSAATVMAKANFKDAQELLGHKNLASTARYLHTTADRVRATHEAVDPLAGILVNTRARKGKKSFESMITDTRPCTHRAGCPAPRALRGGAQYAGSLP